MGNQTGRPHQMHSSFNKVTRCFIYDPTPSVFFCSLLFPFGQTVTCALQESISESCNFQQILKRDMRWRARGKNCTLRPLPKFLTSEFMIWNCDQNLDELFAKIQTKMSKMGRVGITIQLNTRSFMCDPTQIPCDFSASYSIKESLQQGAAATD